VKVLYLITELDVGGAERNLCTLAVEMHRRANIVHVAALDGRGALADMLRKEGIKVTDLGMHHKLRLSFFFNLLKLIRSFRPDVLHSFLFHANLVGRLAGIFRRAPVVISAVRVAEKRRFSHIALDCATQWLTDMEICVSKSVEHFTHSRALIPRRKLCTIPNSTELTGRAFDAGALVKEYPGLEGAKVIMQVGRLDYQKGVDILIKAFRRILPRIPDAFLVLVGEGPQRGALEGLARSLGVKNRIIFAGHHKNVGNLMSGAALIVLASRWEGMPNVLIEAAAVGKPVVSADVEGVREVVQDGKTGLIVTRGSATDLADACVNLLTDNELLCAMGDRARERSSQLFNIETMTDKTLTVYEKLLARKRRFLKRL